MSNENALIWLRLVRQWLRKTGLDKEQFNETGDCSTRFYISRDVRGVVKVTYEFFGAEEFVREHISGDVISIHAEPWPPP